MIILYIINSVLTKSQIIGCLEKNKRRSIEQYTNDKNNVNQSTSRKEILKNHYRNSFMLNFKRNIY